jgi:hypothetical protein
LTGENVEEMFHDLFTTALSAKYPEVYNTLSSNENDVPPLPNQESQESLNKSNPSVHDSLNEFHVELKDSMDSDRESDQDYLRVG